MKLLEDYQELTKDGINMEEMVDDKHCAQGQDLFPFGDSKNIKTISHNYYSIT